MRGLHDCTGFSLVVENGATLVVVQGFLIVEASLLEYRL